MPVIKMGTDERLTTQANAFRYSAAKLSHLEKVGGAEFTLVTIYSDVSSSVSPFKAEMAECLQRSVRDLKDWAERSGKSNAVMLRWVTFASEVVERHGFRLLAECDPGAYALEVGGSTHCYEAAVKGLDALDDYATRLAASDWLVNALSIWVMDGLEYPGDSTYPLSRVASSLAALKRKHEEIESHVSILVGVNTKDNDDVKRGLAKFEADAGIDHMRTIEEANETGLTDLSGLILSSVSSQSKGIGSGGASVKLSV